VTVYTPIGGKKTSIAEVYKWDHSEEGERTMRVEERFVP